MQWWSSCRSNKADFLRVGSPYTPGQRAENVFIVRLLNTHFSVLWIMLRFHFLTKAVSKWIPSEKSFFSRNCLCVLLRAFLCMCWLSHACCAGERTVPGLGWHPRVGILCELQGIPYSRVMWFREVWVPFWNWVLFLKVSTLPWLYGGAPCRGWEQEQWVQGSPLHVSLRSISSWLWDLEQVSYLCVLSLRPWEMEIKAAPAIPGCCEDW